MTYKWIKDTTIDNQVHAELHEIGNQAETLEADQPSRLSSSAEK
jgi:hypothetical protein